MTFSRLLASLLAGRPEDQLIARDDILTATGISTTTYG